ERDQTVERFVPSRHAMRADHSGGVRCILRHRRCSRLPPSAGPPYMVRTVRGERQLKPRKLGSYSGQPGVNQRERAKLVPSPLANHFIQERSDRPAKASLPRLGNPAPYRAFKPWENEGFQSPQDRLAAGIFCPAWE